MKQDEQRTTSKALDRSIWSHALDYVIGATFITSGFSGIYNAISGVRTSFYTHFLFRIGHEEQPNPLKKEMTEWQRQHIPLDEGLARHYDPSYKTSPTTKRMLEGQEVKPLSGSEYLQKHNAWLKEYRNWQRDAIDKLYEVKGSNKFTRAINREWMMIRNTDRFTKSTMIAGTAGILAVATGTVALLKVSKHNNDRIKILLDRLEDKDTSREQ